MAGRKVTCCLRDSAYCFEVTGPTYHSMNIPSIKYWMLQRLAAVAVTLGVLGSTGVSWAVIAVQRESNTSYLPGSSEANEAQAEVMKKKKKKKKKRSHSS